MVYSISNVDFNATDQPKLKKKRQQMANKHTMFCKSYGTNPAQAQFMRCYIQNEMQHLLHMAQAIAFFSIWSGKFNGINRTEHHTHSPAQYKTASNEHIWTYTHRKMIAYTPIVFSQMFPYIWVLYGILWRSALIVLDCE